DVVGVALGATQSVISSQGSSETVTLANPTVSLVVDAGAGNDAVTISSGQTPAFEVKVDGGPGVNSIQGAVMTTAIGAGTEGSDALDGGAGADLVVIYGSGARDDFSIRASGTHVSVTSGAARLDLAGIERVFIDSGAGADTIRLGDLAGTTLASIEVDAASGN